MLLIVSVLAAQASGCGSLDEDRMPRAAEPARAPKPREAPAGEVVRVGRRPEGVAADARTGTVAVALRDPDQLVLLDGGSGRVQRRVTLPAASRHLQLTSPGGRVLVPAERANTLAEVPLSRRLAPDPLRITAVGVQPHDATAVGDRIFVGDERGDTVTVLEEARKVARFAVARQPGGLAPVDDGQAVAVVSVRDRVLELFDSGSLQRLGRVNAGVGPTHVVSDGERTLYVTDTAGDALLIFRTQPELRLVRRLAMPTSPYGIALDRRRERLFVTLTGTNRLVKLWTNGPRTVANVPTVQQPDTVAVDEKTGRAFITGRVEGVLQLLDPGDRDPELRADP